MEFLSPLLSFIIVIGILVFVHELGHFLAAKWMGMRADVFAVGMGPRMLGWNKLTGFSFGPLPKDMELGAETDYRLSWLPIGGYVRILGMIDESMDTSFVDKEPQPWEFRAKKNWQKAIVLIAGVTMNIILAIGIFWFLPLAFGEQDLKTTTIAWVDAGSVASDAGLVGGDRIVTIDGKEMETWGDVTRALGLDEQTGTRRIEVDRSGQRLIRTMEGRDIIRSLASGEGLGIEPTGFKVELGEVISYDPADKAGLKKGDVVLAIDSMPVAAVSQLQRYVRNHAGKEITVHVERGDTTMPLSVTVGADSAIGVMLASSYQGVIERKTFGFLESMQIGVSEVGRTVSLIGASVMHVFRGDVGVRQSFGGPIKIAQMASRTQELGIEPFLRFMALISISLAVMNLLPLPGLDGGHLVFVGIEAVIRREISNTIKILFQQVGIAILLLLMVAVFYLDLTR
jgi:regulator of sigma E protease